MLWYCEDTWQPHTTREAILKRLTEEKQAGRLHEDRWRGWYQLAGGGAGFLLCELDDPREVTAMLQPFMDLVSWDVRAIYELDVRKELAQAQSASQTRAVGGGGIVRPSGT